MGIDRDVIAEAFDIIEAHLRGKGHRVRRDDSNQQFHLACAGVTIDHPAGGGIFVTAVTDDGRAAVLAALADLDAGDEHAAALDEIRSKLVSAIAITTKQDASWLSYIDVPDCSGCDLPCDLLDGLGHLGHCDVPSCDLPCDVPGCDLC